MLQPHLDRFGRALNRDEVHVLAWAGAMRCTLAGQHDRGGQALQASQPGPAVPVWRTPSGTR